MLSGLLGDNSEMLILFFLIFLLMGGEGGKKGGKGLFDGDNIIWILIAVFLLGDFF